MPVGRHCMKRRGFEHFFLGSLDAQRAGPLTRIPPAIDYFSLGHFVAFLRRLLGIDLLQFECGTLYFVGEPLANLFASAILSVSGWAFSDEFGGNDFKTFSQYWIA